VAAFTAVNNASDMQAKDGPLRISKYDKRDLPACEVLLVPNVFVRRNHRFKTGRFRFP
jgi:hypothetical protein